MYVHMQCTSCSCIYSGAGSMYMYMIYLHTLQRIYIICVSMYAQVCCLHLIYRVELTTSKWKGKQQKLFYSE